jgi:hypothetical protein
VWRDSGPAVANASPGVPVPMGSPHAGALEPQPASRTANSYTTVTRREPTLHQTQPDVRVEDDRRESSCLFRRRRRRETALDARIARLGTDSPRGVSEEDDKNPDEDRAPVRGPDT